MINAALNLSRLNGACLCGLFRFIWYDGAEDRGELGPIPGMYVAIAFSR
jgi:hypothetical protein